MPPPTSESANTSGPERDHSIKTIGLVSLGCPKNLVDSEKMLGLLAEQGFVPVADHRHADAIVINTCGFLEASKEESLHEIHQAARLKRDGSCQRLVVAGCLVQRHRAKVLQWCPEVDAIIGVFDRDRIVDAVTGIPQARGTTEGTGRSNSQASSSNSSGNSGGGGDSGGLSGGGGTRQHHDSSPQPDAHPYLWIAANAQTARRDRSHSGDGGSGSSSGGRGYHESDAARLRLTPRHWTYLRISEGCNQNCSFCTIPSIRGKMRSKPRDRVLAEAGELLNDGAFELNLIGQDTTSYGRDIGYEPGLVGLLEALDRAAATHHSRSAPESLPGITPSPPPVSPPESPPAWLRLMYAYPSCFTDPMIDAIGRLSSVAKYIDMPLQHINDRVLDHMKRRTSRKLIETLLEKLRQRVPGIAIRTTFITGFPGETASQHRELVRFIRDFGFDALGVFAYSPEPGTPAGTRHRQGHAVPDPLAQDRLEELMLTQQEVVFARNRTLAQLRARFDVLIDAASPPPVPTTDPSTAAHHYVGRTYQQAPQVDAVTYVLSREPLAPGELVPCRVTASHEYDLITQPLADLDTSIHLPLLSYAEPGSPSGCSATNAVTT